MKKIAVVCTGGKSPLSISLPPHSFVIAADSGLEVAHRLHLVVDHAIGDFDSLNNMTLLDSVSHTILEREKDISDTEAALIHLQKIGIEHYILIGGGEGRFDHLIHLYSLFSLYGAPIEWITEREHLYKIEDNKKYNIPIASTVSVLPIHPKSFSKVSCNHLKWELKNFIVDSNHMSLSNIITHSPLSFAIEGDSVFLSLIN